METSPQNEPQNMSAEQPMPVVAKGPSPYLTPIAVVVGAVIIAFALMVGTPKPPTPVDGDEALAAAKLEDMIPLSREDHIRGNPDAPIKIVEYSDTECPFCKQFHTTLKRIMDEYGPSGKVAWVYRHFPLDSLHPNARTQAEATECAASLGGEDAFWGFLDRLMASAPNEGTPLSALPTIAKEVGVDVAAFTACLEKDTFASKVQTHADNAVLTGGGGTPWNIVVTASGKKIPIGGAYPYEYVKNIIDTALADE